MIHLFLVQIVIYVHINSIYDYACIEMKNVHNATFPFVLHDTIAKPRIDETIYNVLSLLVEYNLLCLFVWIDALCPNQQQWSCQDAASILWDVMISNKYLKYNHPSKPILLICIGSLTWNHFF